MRNLGELIRSKRNSTFNSEHYHVIKKMKNIAKAIIELGIVLVGEILQRTEG